MYADLDELVLSGKLFNDNSRSSSPQRSPSPDSVPTHVWPDTKEDYEDNDQNESDIEREDRIAQIMRGAPSDAPESAVGMGPGRTGVKGVIRDRAEAQRRQREHRAQEIKELNSRMERANLGGKTFLEEEREKEWERAMLEGAPPGAQPMNGKKHGKFGHLREVGVKNFVSAVESEDKGVWVVVHIFDPSLDRCYNLDVDLAQLARLEPNVKFLRSRASALGFASKHSSNSLSNPQKLSKKLVRSRYLSSVDDDDIFGDDADAGDTSDEDDDDKDEDVDLDVLPTLLAYMDGMLEHTWVRVDWEAGKVGISELLSKHNILKAAGHSLGNCGLPSDEDDLWASEPEDP